MLIFVRMFVCSFGSNLSRALNLHNSDLGLSQVSLRSLSGVSQVLSGLSQVSLKSLSGLSQVSLRSISGLS